MTLSKLCQPFMKSRSRSKLIQILLAKSVAEAVLVAAIAVTFYFAVTNRHLRGVLDSANNQMISGWVVNESEPWARVEVQLYIDNMFVSDTASDEYRPDVRQAKRALDDWHGFVFPTPPLAAGAHEARVYAVHVTGNGTRRSLQLIGKPLRFEIAAVDKD